MSIDWSSPGLWVGLIFAVFALAWVVNFLSGLRDVVDQYDRSQRSLYRGLGSELRGGFLARNEVDPAALMAHPKRHEYWVSYVVGDVDHDVEGFNLLPVQSLGTHTIRHEVDPLHQRSAARLLEAAMVNGEAAALDQRLIDKLGVARRNRLARHLVKVGKRQTRKRRKAK